VVVVSGGWWGGWLSRACRAVQFRSDDVLGECGEDELAWMRESWG
jgi:hypothetical protein